MATPLVDKRTISSDRERQLQSRLRQDRVVARRQREEQAIAGDDQIFPGLVAGEEAQRTALGAEDEARNEEIEEPLNETGKLARGFASRKQSPIPTVATKPEDNDQDSPMNENAGPEMLSVTPQTLRYQLIEGQVATAQSVRVTGSSSSLWQATTNTAWIMVLTASGNASQPVQIAATAVGLPEGSYTGAVTISIDGQSSNVSVSLQVSGKSSEKDDGEKKKKEPDSRAKKDEESGSDQASTNQVAADKNNEGPIGEARASEAATQETAQSTETLRESVRAAQAAAKAVQAAEATEAATVAAVESQGFFAAIVATSEIWVPIVVVALIILGIVVLIVYFAAAACSGETGGIIDRVPQFVRTFLVDLAVQLKCST